jgi:hypothetical protein
MRTQPIDQHPTTPRLSGALNNSVWMGILPPSIALTGHTHFLQRLFEVGGGCGSSSAAGPQRQASLVGDMWLACAC